MCNSACRREMNVKIDSAHNRFRKAVAEHFRDGEAEVKLVVTVYEHGEAVHRESLFIVDIFDEDEPLLDEQAVEIMENMTKMIEEE